VVDKFYYLKLGLSVVLTFVGLKMVLADIYKIPIGASLLVIATVLVAAIVASWLRARRRPEPVSGAVEPNPAPEGRRELGRTQ
jgi:tellurite resistance protein TerC